MATFTKWNGQTLVFQPMPPVFEFFDPAQVVQEYRQEAPHHAVYYRMTMDRLFQERTREFGEWMVQQWWQREKPFWWNW